MTTHTLTRKHIGPNGRYELSVFWTRFDTIEYVVCDLTEVDQFTGLPAMIRQESSYAQAVAGLTH